MNQTNKKFHIGILAALTLATLFVWYMVWQSEHRQFLTVAFLDVDQGDAIFIEAPNGNQVVIDGGPDGSLLTELGKVMPFYDRSIDMLMVTNPDKDHYAGFIDVLEQYRVLGVVTPSTHTDTSTYARFESSVEEQGIPALQAKQGMRLVLDAERGVYLDILFPDQDVSTWKSNDGSIVARLVYDEASVMLTGDSTTKTESIIMGDYPKESLQSDILKVGHHGSKTSSSEAFLKVIAPEMAVISAGYHNSYGLPKQEILDRLKKLKIPTLITYEEGTIIVRSDGKSFWRK